MSLDYLKLKEYLKAKTLDNVPITFRPIVAELSQEKFVERYIDLLVLQEELRKKRFKKKPGIKTQMNFVYDFNLAYIFLQSETSQKLPKIKDQDAITRWQLIRNSSDEYATIPLDKGIEMARRQLKIEKLKQFKLEYIKKLKENYSIKRKKIN